MTAKYSSMSRYSLTEDGRSAYRPDSTLNDSRRFTTYTVRGGDTLESISNRLLGSPLRYWELADLNPQIKFPMDIKVGSVIRIPL